MNPQEIFATAVRYMTAGLDVIPDDPIQKFPVGFKGWESKKFTEEELKDCILNKGYGIGIRNLEVLDFDNHAGEAKETIKTWVELVNKILPNFTKKLVIEQTQNNGYHVGWKCEVIEGNQKLASRLPSEPELAKESKTKAIAFIETRGLGGQFVATPTPGYRLLRGDWSDIPVITPEEREVLIDCAKSLNKIPDRTYTSPESPTGGTRPGDKYSETDGITEALQILKDEGWKEVYTTGGAVYLQRPGKDRGTSATYGYVAPGIFYNFSANGSPFEEKKSYTPFQVFALLKHNGNFPAAASELANKYEVDGKTRESKEGPVAEVENYAETWRQSKDDKSVVYSGFPRLDASIGGFEAGRTYIPGGLEKCGKSTFLMNMLDNMLKDGVRVGYVDTELGHKDFFRRFAAINSRFHEKDIRNDRANIQQWVERFLDTDLVSYSELKDILQDGIPNLELTKRRFDSWIHKGAKVLVFDNITTIQNYTIGDLQGWQVLASFFNGLVKYAQEKEIILFLVLHTKPKDLLVSESFEKIKKILEDENPRGIFDKSVTVNYKPNKSFLYGGGGMLSQITGGIMFLWRPYQDFGDPEYQRVSQLILEDFRSQSQNFVNEIDLDFDSTKSLYSELSEEEIEEREAQETEQEKKAREAKTAEIARRDKEKKAHAEELKKTQEEFLIKGMKMGTGLKKEEDLIKELAQREVCSSESPNSGGSR